MMIEAKTKARKYFKRLRHIDKEITAKVELCERLRHKAATVKPHLNNPGKNEKLAGVQAKLHGNVQDLANFVDEAVTKIDTLQDSAQRALITMHYLNGTTLVEIREAMGYSEGHLHRIHNKALTELAKVLD